jgi:phage FluMu gp28-like protein
MSIEAALKGSKVWWVAPTFRLTEAGYEYIEEVCEAIPNVDHQKSKRKFVFPGGGFIQIQSADDPDQLRSRALDLVVLDEAAFMDVAAWDNIRPALTTTAGRAVFLSSPYGKNWFWELYQRGQDPNDPNWHSVTYPQSASPLITPEEIEDARRTMPERKFRREILAEFVDAGGEVFYNVRDAAIAEMKHAPEPGHDYVVGVDWGSRQDFTVMVVFDATASAQVYMHRTSGADFGAQYKALEDLYALWRPIVVLAEENSIGQVHIHELRQRGIPVQAFNTSRTSKRELIEAWASALETRQALMLNDQTILREHMAYESMVLPSGHVQFYAPSGHHDDTVIASALAWRAATGGKGMGRAVLSVPTRGLYQSKEVKGGFRWPGGAA